MYTKYNISKEFDAIVEASKKQNQNPSEEELLKSFHITSAIGREAWENNSSDENIKVTKDRIESFDGKKINIQIIEPKDIGENAPCLIYYHGGAFIMPAFQYHVRLTREYAVKASCKVIHVDYRLAPENPFPIGIKDCYSALVWAYENAGTLGINREKIAVGGDSAGGSLAAAVTQMARDKRGPQICFQMLCYPVTDSRQNTQSMKIFNDTPSWSTPFNKIMWNIYLRRGNKGTIQYAAPLEAESFKNLPDAYIEVAEFDPLRDEGKAYADNLKAKGVNVEFVQTKGTVHAYDMIAESSITKESEIRRINALRRAFN